MSTRPNWPRHRSRRRRAGGGPWRPGGRAHSSTLVVGPIGGSQTSLVIASTRVRGRSSGTSPRRRGGAGCDGRLTRSLAAALAAGAGSRRRIFARSAPSCVVWGGTADAWTGRTVPCSPRSCGGCPEHYVAIAWSLRTRSCAGIAALSADDGPTPTGLDAHRSTTSSPPWWCVWRRRIRAGDPCDSELGPVGRTPTVWGHWSWLGGVWTPS
jgi:hypothetical protein